MDEYTFLIAAQLKADREKLEREQASRERREGVARPNQEVESKPTRFIPLFSWR